jgi:hypothetical protein
MNRFVFSLFDGRASGAGFQGILDSGAERDPEPIIDRFLRKGKKKGNSYLSKKGGTAAMI